MSKPDYSELESDFGDVIDILRQGRLTSPTEKPGADVWNAIAEGLSGEVAPIEEEPVQPVEADHRDVVSLGSRRSLGRRFAIVTAIAAALLLVAVPVGLAMRGDGAKRIELAALGNFTGAGEAELKDRTLVVDLEGLEDLGGGATYDVWLLNLDADNPQDPRWIGFAEADGAFTIPEDVDLNEFTVVDVSIEPDDGDPAHSGDSVLRGELGEV